MAEETLMDYLLEIDQKLYVKLRTNAEEFGISLNDYLILVIGKGLSQLPQNSQDYQAPIEQA